MNEVKAPVATLNAESVVLQAKAQSQEPKKDVEVKEDQRPI